MQGSITATLVQLDRWLCYALLSLDICDPLGIS